MRFYTEPPRIDKMLLLHNAVRLSRFIKQLVYGYFVAKCHSSACSVFYVEKRGRAPYYCTRIEVSFAPLELKVHLPQMNVFSFLNMMLE